MAVETSMSSGIDRTPGLEKASSSLPAKEWIGHVHGRAIEMTQKH